MGNAAEKALQTIHSLVLEAKIHRGCACLICRIRRVCEGQYINPDPALLLQERLQQRLKDMDDNGKADRLAKAKARLDNNKHNAYKDLVAAIKVFDTEITRATNEYRSILDAEDYMADLIRHEKVKAAVPKAV